MNLVGTTIKVKEEHKKAVETIVEQKKKAIVAYELAIGEIERNKKQMYNLIKDLYPETKDYGCSVNIDGDSFTISFIWKRVKESISK